MKSIQGKMFAAFGMAICLAIIPIAYSAYYNSAKVIEQNAIAYISDRIQGANDNLQSMIEEADKIATVIVVNRDLVHDGLLSGMQAPTYEWFQEKKAVEDFLRSMAAFKSYIQQISVVGRDGAAFYTGARRGNPEHVASLWGDAAFAENRRHLLFDPDGNGKMMIMRPVLQNGEWIGMCIVDFDPDIVRHVYNIEPLSESIVSVIDDRGKIVYDSRPDRIRRQVQDTELSSLLEGIAPGQQVSHKIEFEERAYLAVQSHSRYTGWTTIGMVPLRVLLSEVSDIRYQIVTIAAIVLAAVLLISIWLSNQITKNIKRLHSAMKLVREGHMNARPRIRTSDEVGQLSDMFVSMMDHVQELLHVVKTRERQRREAEYRALQAQIKPHFLYNTLNTIKYLARIQQARNIEEISGSLIELLRFAIDPQRDMIAVREELAQVERYVSIQKYKFLDRIHVTVDAEAAVLDCLIPKLILQPVVENALNHGLGRTDCEGSVSIRVYGDGAGRLILSVTDDGVGIPEERLSRLLEQEPPAGAEQPHGIGLRNIRERIRHAFGEPYGLTVYSQADAFTTVEITVPRTRREQPDALESRYR